MRDWTAGLALGVSVMAIGCSGPTYQEEFDAGNFESADAMVDEEIDGDGRVEDNEPLYVMDKAMVALAQGEPLDAVSLMLPIRPTLDERYIDTLLDWLDPSPKRLANPSGLGDFVGADYEQLVVYGMIAMCEFLGHGTDRDVTPHTFALDQKQKRMLDGDEELGDNDPRKNYNRLALGQYLEGIMHEARLDWDGAKKSFETAASFDPGSALLKQAAAGQRLEGDSGALYVIYMGGRGPRLGSRNIDPAAEVAVRGLLALIQAATTNGAIKAISIDQALQGTVPVPMVAVQTSAVAPLNVTTSGLSARTQVLLDVNDVAKQQVAANRAMRIAQTVLLRAVRQAGGNQTDNLLLRRTLNLGVSLAESADTRCWETLPAEFQAVRLELPAGTQTVQLGPDMSAEVVVRTGASSLVLVWDRPDWDEGVVIVDKGSRPSGG